MWALETGRECWEENATLYKLAGLPHTETCRPWAVAVYSSRSRNQMELFLLE